MHQFFISIHSVFNRWGKRALIPFALLVFAIVFFLQRINLEEDISSLIPMDERIAEMSQTFANSKFADQLVFMVSLKDSSQRDESRLIEVVDELSNFLEADSSYVKSVRNSVDESAIARVYDYFYRNLPFYLSDADYAYLDTTIEKQHLQPLMEKNYKSIIAPTGFGTARYILKDPLSIVPRFLERLQSFQLDKNFTLHQSHIFTKDKKHALCFLEPAYSSKNTKENRLLIDRINSYLANSVPADVSVEYYGGTAVAVANADRVKGDVYVTVSIALVLLLLLFFFVFRNIRVLFFLFTPVVLGVGVALSILSVLYTNLSAISLGVGAILIGISIDFSLHYFSHVRYGHSAKGILKDISDPVIMSSLTTASAFLCLNVVNSQALNQLGLFAGLSVLAASVLVLICLPLLFKGKAKYNAKTKTGFYDRIAAFELHTHKYWIWSVLVLSVLFFFLGKSIQFDADIAKLNYLPSSLAKAEKKLKSISSEASSAIFVVASGDTQEEVLQTLEKNQNIFSELQNTDVVASLSSPTTLLLSDKKQREQLNRWNQFWAGKGIDTVVNEMSSAGEASHFKINAFKAFYKLLKKDFQTISVKDEKMVKDLFLSNLINEQGKQVSMVTICKVDQANKPQFFKAIGQKDELLILDKQFFTNRFFEVLKDDFSKLINYSMVVVFLIVLLFWGRIELALVTFVPIVISWQWTIGLMGLFDIHFNIFNIIICTFIFGLGIDYSIFLMQGMINNHKYGSRSLLPYKVSILLSVSTTLIGVGVLIFAQHPALKSIALVTVLGILSVVLITFTILPFMFKLLVVNKGKHRVAPIHAIDVFVSITSFLIFLAGVIFLSLLVLVFRITPFFTKAKKSIIHYLVYLTCKLVVGVNFLFKKDYIDKHKFDLSKPAVLVCNHQSHLDIALILLMSPKIIVLTNEWVWKNPFYGFIIRYIDFFPIYTGIDKGYEKIKRKVDQGYSVLVFPEGTRTKTGNINRFHQGAFSLADYLNLDILPVLLHGAYECMPKTEFFLRAGHITLKFFDRVKVNEVDVEKGITYRPQAKLMTAFYRSEYEKLKQQKQDVDYFAHKLINQYIYKGPVLEWYMRVKIRLEKNYRFYDELVPKQGKIIDVGCGYGFLANMLSYTAPQREIVGWDYDGDKIAVARQVAEDNECISFYEKDVVAEEFEAADTFIFNDVLHYFSKEKQLQVLEKALNNLNDKGTIIIRDADTELKKRTRVTRLTEFFSIRLLGFNKMDYELDFVSSEVIKEFAREKGLGFEKVDNAKYTSNLTYILSANGV
ncbi:MMPL family transporter [Carboxylicivirga sp. A043]|uniref:trifunctional MMPL family transporter/lysophospholipid acyltransferase/class I SAM-dependent methyltransferase n=1 Tax=Carboxylicivirga litoralis TaxID=2816963 RepID=UPI0021CB066C|nr:trifunctional MMPL family transporter/lysophospholipid acyltransferase/class I SAM-dependent methyltransferase [Carboxylicivirga sp. A043]MCU4154363.1 MMPL family transporter [Carboxylicivirga sp. A043]